MMEMLVTFQMTIRPVLGALAAVAALGLSPAMAQTEFRGGGFLSDFSSQCNAAGWSGTSQVVVRFRPAGASGNHATENRMSLFFDSYTMFFGYSNSAIGSYANATSAGMIGASFSSQTSPAVQVRRQNPPASTTFNASELHLVVDINNFDQTANCSVRANLWLYRR